MILQGIGRLVRNYPHVPGIDFAGTVERSDSPEFKPGDPVILTGWRVGETQWGGYAEKARVPASYSGAPAGGDQRPPGDGDRHRRVHGDAGGHRSGAARAQTRRGRCAGHRRGRRCRQRRGGAAFAARASGCRIDRPPRAARLSDRARRGRSDRSCGTRGKTVAAARQRALGRSDRRGRRDDLGDDPDPAQIPGERRRLRPCRRQRSAGDGDPVSAARGQSARHRLGHVPARRADRGVAAAGARSAARQARPDDRDRAAFRACPSLRPKILGGAIRGRIVVDVTA